MAAAGTLLADLDQGGGGDGDLVQKILSDMNIPTASTQRSAPPPLPAQAPIYQQQMASSTSHMNMDSRIPTSHMIGNEHPSPADFANAMGPSMGQMGGMPMGGMPMGGMPMGGMPMTQQMQMPGMTTPGNYEPSKNMYSKLLDEMKVPFVVAILFFLFSLPPIRVLLSHYIPSMIKQTGELQTTGLLAVSGVVGVTFWLLQRVIAPLLSL
jgi:hypothetical protein